MVETAWADGLSSSNTVQIFSDASQWLIWLLIVAGIALLVFGGRLCRKGPHFKVKSLAKFKRHDQSTTDRPDTSDSESKTKN